jgi:hypothetical protein
MPTKAPTLSELVGKCRKVLIGTVAVVAFFVYIICGFCALDWQRKNNSKGMDCVIAQMSDMHKLRTEIKSCTEWDQMRTQIPWYVKIYNKATFEKANNG